MSTVRQPHRDGDVRGITQRDPRGPSNERMEDVGVAYATTGPQRLAIDVICEKEADREEIARGGERRGPR